MKATAQAHANIALVKYWGKRDPILNLPAAGSLSMTLAGLTTTTTVTFGDTTADTLILDGTEAKSSVLSKALKVIDPIRQIGGITDTPVLIESANDFPTGAGLASSASGLAALTTAAAAAAGLELERTALSRIARVGSGSACRSLYGGFAEWHAGTEADGSDSYAVGLYPAEHWDLSVVVAVVAQGPKHTGSTEGMTHTRDTSPYHEPYLSTVDTDLAAARKAIANKDFSGLGQVAERSCLRMHAAMMGAHPPLIYLQPQSWMVIDAVRAMQADGLPVFFTIDAGPNVKVFCESHVVPEVRRRLLSMTCVEKLVTATPGQGARILTGGVQ